MQPVNLRSENWFIITSILSSDAAHAFDGHDLASFPYMYFHPGVNLIKLLQV